MQFFLRFNLGIVALIAAASAAPASAQDAERVPRSIYLGMDANFARTTLDGFPGQYEIIAPVQSLRVSTSLGNSFRVEAPLKVVLSSSSLFGKETQINTGLLLDVFPSRWINGRSTSVQTGFFVGGGALVSYSNDGGTQTQYGVVGRAGYEFPFTTARIRVAALFERSFESDYAIGRKTSGISVGMSYPVLGDQSARSDVWDTGWYAQTRMGINHQIIGDYETRESFNLPKAFFGVFHFPGSQRLAAFGIRGNIQYSGNDQLSNSYVLLQPRVEINLLSRSSSRKGIQVGAHGIVEHAGGTASDGYSYGASFYGGGGDVSLTLPVMPTMVKIGVGFDRNAPSSRRPGVTSFRFDVALDRYLMGNPKPSKK